MDPLKTHCSFLYELIQEHWVLGIGSYNIHLNVYNFTIYRYGDPNT